MTAEQQREWDHVYQNRLGALFDVEPKLQEKHPPGWAREIAAKEADEAVENMRKP